MARIHLAVHYHTLRHCDVLRIKNKIVDYVALDTEPRILRAQESEEVQPVKIDCTKNMATYDAGRFCQSGASSLSHCVLLS